jgi:DNA (cytosine-5)-methyltransferase 1
MRHASLFSGIGGPEVAAAMLGWENVFHCEINDFGRKVLEYWFPESDSYDDITKTEFTRYRGTIDVLTGGFPCQPFSYAGRRGGQEDQRYLWPQMLRVINEVRPTWVIGENVAGITTMVEQCRITEMGSEATLFEEGSGVHRYGAEYAFTIERIYSDLESVGYSVQPMLIPACAVGAPHRRDRIFFIAYNAQDTLCNGLQCRQAQEQECQRNERNIGTGDCEWVCGKERIVASDSINKRLEGKNKSGSGEGREQMHIRRDFAGCCWKDSLRPEERWKDFPTVSAVHRGNDGIPFNVDSLSIPFSKWRNETIKAYGNAIVPQVMYRIFEAIEALQ